MSAVFHPRGTQGHTLRAAPPAARTASGSRRVTGAAIRRDADDPLTRPRRRTRAGAVGEQGEHGGRPAGRRPRGARGRSGGAKRWRRRAARGQARPECTVDTFSALSVSHAAAVRSHSASYAPCHGHLGRRPCAQKHICPYSICHFSEKAFRLLCGKFDILLQYI